MESNSASSVNFLADKEFRLSVFQTGQKYLINTLFDTVNSILGVVIGLYLADEQNAYVFIMSIISTAIALGISSGTSIYEAEYFEQLRDIKEIEKHMITNFKEKNPIVAKKAKTMGLFVGIINFLTPLLIALVLVLILLTMPNLAGAFWAIMGFSGLVLFGSGIIFGKMNQLPPIKRGVRMLIIGFLTFAAVYTVGYLF